jgi:hypothetical protein
LISGILVGGLFVGKNASSGSLSRSPKNARVVS